MVPGGTVVVVGVTEKLPALQSDAVCGVITGLGLTVTEVEELVPEQPLAVATTL